MDFTNEERERERQYAHDYDARTLAGMLVGVERAHAVDRKTIGALRLALRGLAEKYDAEATAQQNNPAGSQSLVVVYRNCASDVRRAVKGGA